jgi:ketosteroid isomerase-like protein
VPQAESAQIIAALNAWANAWSRKDADAYLAFYAQDFNVPGGAPRAKWEAMRRSRIAKPRKIEVEIAEPKVSINTPDSAVVAFRQHYRSDTLDEWNNKIVVFVRAGGRWLIQEESAPK